jgi:hypothetical protein
MKPYKIFVFILIFITGFFVSKAQQSNDSLAQKMDAYLLSANKFNRFNGSALIAEKGAILLQKSYGYKNFASMLTTIPIVFTRSGLSPNNLLQLLF